MNFSRLLTLLGCLLLSQSALADDAPSGQDVPTQRAIFAGGCFWCMEPPFDKLDGVISTTSGYSGGRVVDPTYKQVSAGTTGHTEVVEIVYDPAKIGYEELLQVFWLNIDPLAENRQFCDRGSQYRSAIFYVDENQRELAEASLDALQDQAPFDGKIHTEIARFDRFYAAEDYHQDYYLRNPLRYKFYRGSCGRDKRLKVLWGGRKQAFQLPIGAQ